VKKCALFLLMLCVSVALKAQTDTVAAKIRKVPNIKVDVLAKFPGGDFAKYIAANIVFPKKVDKNMHGQVVLSMKIDSNGRISNVNILKTMTPDIDQALTRVVKASPKWKPAMLNAKPVTMYLVFNIDMGILGAASAAAAKEKKDAAAIVNKPAPPAIKKTTTPPPAESKVVTTIPKAAPVLTKKIVIKPPVEKKAIPVAIKTTASVTNKPVLKAIKKQLPPFDKKPLPVVQKKPAPQVIKKADKPAEKKPLPVIQKKPIPQVVKKADKPVEKMPLVAPPR